MRWFGLALMKLGLVQWCLGLYTRSASAIQHIKWFGRVIWQFQSLRHVSCDTPGFLCSVDLVHRHTISMGTKFVSKITTCDNDM